MNAKTRDSKSGDESNEQTAIEQLVDEIDGLNYYGVTISVTEFNNDGDITVSLYKDKSARDVKNTRIYYNDDTEQWRCVMGDDGYAVIDKALNKLNESGVVPADEAYEHATDGGQVQGEVVKQGNPFDQHHDEENGIEIMDAGDMREFLNENKNDCLIGDRIVLDYLSSSSGYGTITTQVGKIKYNGTFSITFVREGDEREMRLELQPGDEDVISVKTSGRKVGEVRYHGRSDFELFPCASLERATDGGVVTDDIESSDYIERALERAEAHERTGTAEFVGTSKDMDILSEVIEMGVKAYNEADNEPIDEDRFWPFTEALIDRMHELDGNEFYDDGDNAEVWR